jgi:hypothetical protein
VIAAAPPFTHLARLTDETGIFEHASGPMPRTEGGYCLDDAARALIVVCRERVPTPQTDRLTEIYFRFVLRAQASDGTCHNRLSSAGRWIDEPTTGDWWGRALWGLGTAAARSTQPWIRATATARFGRSGTRRSPHLHSMAFAALGAAEVLSVWPDHRSARDLLRAAASMVGRPNFSRGWPWPQSRLRYANAAIPDALMAAGSWLGNDGFLADGLGLLGWLLDVETNNGHLSVTPADG